MTIYTLRRLIRQHGGEMTVGELCMILASGAVKGGQA